MSTTRVGFANALLSAIKAPHTADAMHVVIAWQMVEGQTPGENDPLASLNEHDPHGTGGASNRFSFASIDNALAQSSRQLNPGGPYVKIGDAFRAGKKAPDLIAAIGRGGWAGGPMAPSPTYAPALRVRYNQIQDQATYAREAQVVVGTSSITGAPPHYDNSGGITTGDVVSSIPGAGIAKSAMSATEAIGSVASHLVDPDLWKRVGVMTVGALMVLWGLLMLGRVFAPGVTASVKNAAKAATIV